MLNGGSGIKVVRGFQEGSNDGYAGPREAFWIKTVLITVFSALAAALGYGIYHMFDKEPEPIQLKVNKITNKPESINIDNKTTIILDPENIKKFGALQTNIETYSNKIKVYEDSLKMAESKMTEELKKFVGSTEKQINY